ncbi:MAG: single-stranded DNA-binding protein [Mogibacterium sp.]|nr:single-stranded DNA-binding protein [Mogibacterium sp.]
MNSVVLIGNLARDPELSYSPNTQMAICHFTIAVSRPRRNGEDQGADFIRVTVFGRQGENCDRYLSKGSKVAVQGRIQTGSYKNREGVTVYTTDIVANNVEFLSGSQGGGQSQGYQRGQSYQGSNGQNQSYQGSAGFQSGNSFGNDAPAAFDTQDTGFGPVGGDFGGFDDMPDTFQAAEDDIPF